MKYSQRLNSDPTFHRTEETINVVKDRHRSYIAPLHFVNGSIIVSNLSSSYCLCHPNFLNEPRNPSTGLGSDPYGGCRESRSNRTHTVYLFYLGARYSDALGSSGYKQLVRETWVLSRSEAEKRLFARVDHR